MNQDDRHLFQKAMESVKPLNRSKKVMHAPKPSNQPKSQNAPKSKISEDIDLPPAFFSDPRDVDMLPSEGILVYGKKSLNHKQWMQFKSGKMRIDQQLDLHHHTLDQARRILPGFISEAYTAGLRCVLVIHGKGGHNHRPPAMKNHVFHWLQQMSHVLAIHSAAPSHGGLGAAYVLIRANRTLDI